MAVPTRINVKVFPSSAIMINGGSTNYLIETPSGVIYSFFRELTQACPSFAKSIDGGITWTVTRFSETYGMTQMAVWYDRWSGINGDLIHVVYTDSGTDDVFYRNINTANNDSLSTEYTVFAGASTANGGALSISRMRGGNLIVVGSIDAATEIFSKKSTNVGVNWSDITAGYESGGTADLCIVAPGWDADTNDAMMFYYDRSATEISVKYYDDSANSWSETSIATTISLPDHTTATLGHMAATVDLTNSQNLLVFWTAVDAANADLRCFKVTQSTQTETTSNVVLNSTDDQGFCAISICPLGCWYVLYAGKSNGTETYNTSLNIYYKVSSDGGSTWSTEAVFDNNIIPNITLFFKSLFVYKRETFAALLGSSHFVVNVPVGIPRATYQLGI